MIKLVVAPNKRQFEYFVRTEQLAYDPHNPAERMHYRYVVDAHQLNGYRGELIIINADQLPLNELSDLAMMHNDKGATVRFVDLP